MMDQDRYFDAVASRYDSLYDNPLSQGENLLVAEDIAVLIHSAAEQVQSILDIGCGTGLMLDMTPHFGCADARYVGTDLSETMLRRLREKHATRSNTETHRCDMNTFDLRNLKEEFDLVLSTFGAFSYVKDPLNFLQDVKHILKKGNGHLLVMAYSRFSVQNIWARLKQQNPKYTDEVRPYVYRNDSDRSSNGPLTRFHTSTSLTDAAHRAGLHRISVQGLNFFLDSTENKPASTEDAIKALRKERLQIPSPDLSHSLILTASNYE